MARILHVEDNHEWVDLTRRALPDHHVDSAASYSEALAFLQASPPYDLALVDLYLLPDESEGGAELLDLLRFDYPSTARIVLTGRPPAGPVRANIFERYGVEDIIIKGNVTLTGLREVISEALGRDVADVVPQDVKIRKSELSQRYRDWHTSLEDLIRDEILRAERYASRSSAQHGHSKHDAPDKLSVWMNMRERFRHECSEIEAILSDAKSMKDVIAGTQKLDRAVATFANELNELQPSAKHKP